MRKSFILALALSTMASAAYSLSAKSALEMAVAFPGKVVGASVVVLDEVVQLPGKLAHKAVKLSVEGAQLSAAKMQGHFHKQ